MDTVTYSKEQGQYIVNLPWKDSVHKLQSNFQLALGRLRGLQRQFQKDPTYCEQYCNIINDQLSRGFIEEVDNTTQPGYPIHYLAHHGIKKNTPVRVVHDCSAKTSPDSLSLNDCL